MEPMCILSVDPGARQPGIAVVEVWPSNDESAKWPQFRPIVLMGDPVVPSTVMDVKKHGIHKCIDALHQYFSNHREALFGARPVVAIIETQKGLHNRFADKLSVAMYTLLCRASELYGAPADMIVRMCPATWKTQGLGVEAGDAQYDRRKEATRVCTQELLCAAGYVSTAARLSQSPAVRDISDAFMQAIQFYKHEGHRRCFRRRK